MDMQVDMATDMVMSVLQLQYRVVEVVADDHLLHQL
jgi:hypothetical protein